MKKHLSLVPTLELNNNQVPSIQTALFQHPINLPELFIKLKVEETRCLELRKTMKIRELKRFTNRLEQLGKDYNCQLLLDYSYNLKSDLDTFNISQIPHSLDQFSSILQTLETLI